jgi:hypothetical protein
LRCLGRAMKGKAEKITKIESIAHSHFLKRSG